MESRQFSEYYNIVSGKDGKSPFVEGSDDTPMVTYNFDEGPFDMSLFLQVMKEVRVEYKKLGFDLEGSEDSPFVDAYGNAVSQMHKEVKSVLKGLRQYADPPSSYDIVQKRHFRVSWEMVNDDGKRVRVQETVCCSPSDRNWMHSHRRRLQRKFRELNISTEVTHI